MNARGIAQLLTRSCTVWCRNDAAFNAHVAEVTAWHTGMSSLPVLWWETLLGAPSTAAGAYANHYRAKRLDYCLTHPDRLVWLPVTWTWVWRLFRQSESDQHQD